MAVNVNCPGCRTSYPITEELLGKTIRCKKCQETFIASAAKSTVATRTDERITSRVPAKGGNGRYADDEDDAPRRNGNGNGNGRARPMAKRPAEKSGNKGLLIGGIAGGVCLLAAGVGLGIWMLKGDETPDNSNANGNTTPPITSVTPVKPVDTPPEVTKIEPEKKPANQGASNPTMTTVAPIPKYRPPRIDPNLLKKIEKSAVLIRCTVAQGAGEGSGWFAEPGIIVTNSHVVFMKEAATPPPDKIDVTLYSGEANEEKVPGELLAIDRDEDLAIIRVKSKNLPPPLTVVPSADLRTSEKVYIMGFPLGTGIMEKMGLQKTTKVTVKTREAPVAGRITNAEDGSVKYIQTEGGADHGNSGGAVLDTNGNVVAILVAGLGDFGSNMRYVIPSEYATYLLQGRILRVIPGQALSSGAGIMQPIGVDIADPLKRIRKVSIDVWTGKPGKLRPASTSQPTPVEGDGPKVTLDLPYDPNQHVELGASHRVKGEMNLPTLAPNEVYWFQPHYVSKSDKDRWGEAIPIEMGRYPVEAKSANLSAKYKEGQENHIELNSQAEFSIEVQGRGGHRDLGLTANMLERVQKLEKEGEAKVRLKYTSMKMSDPDEDEGFRKALHGVMEQVKNLAADVTMTADGLIKKSTPDFANVPQSARPVLRIFNEQILESLDALTVSLPNKDIQPGESWDSDVPYTINIGTQPQNALFHTKYTYLGTRTRDGRLEAVVTMDGLIVKKASDLGTGSGRGGRGRPSPTPTPRPAAPADGGEEDDTKANRNGFILGAAVIDLATGQVSVSRNVTEMAMEVQFAQNVKGLAAGAMDLTLRRTAGPAPKANANTKAPSINELLPGLPKRYNPVVVEDTSATVGTPPEPIAPGLPAADQLSPEIVKKVEKATVWIHVFRGEEGSTGSGWLAGPNGIIVTNSHVVGMKEKGARPPDTVDVVLDAGKPTTRKYPAKILALDRFEDLCVLKIDAPNLPEPLAILSSQSLNKSDPLFISGFSMGTRPVKILKEKLNELAVSVKIRETTVGGTIERTDGTRQYVQVDSAADPGNSGGPVVDNKGRVRAILVAGYAVVAKSALVWTIPSEYALRMLDGYPMEVHPDRPYLNGSVATQPIEIQFADPNKRVKKVAVDYWIGDPGKPRPAGDSAAKSVGGDSKHSTVQLAYDPARQVATGDFPLPDAAKGQVLWIQPRFTNGTGKELWYKSGAVRPTGAPLDRTKVVKLETKFVNQSRRDIELITNSNISFSLFGQETHIGTPFKAVLSEHVIGKTKNTARLSLEYESLEIDLKKIFPQLEGAPPQIEAAYQAQLRPLLNYIRGVITLVDVRDGRMKLVPNGLSYARVPPPLQEQMAKFNSQVVTSLQALTFPMPAKPVKYGDTWDFPTDLFIPSRNSVQGALFDMKFKYLGVRQNSGRQEAVVEITGSLVGSPNAKGVEPGVAEGAPAGDPAGSGTDDKPETDNSTRLQYKPPAGADTAKKKGIYGDAHGYAIVDVDGGFVAEVDLKIDLQVEMMVKDLATRQDVPVIAGGVMELQLRRRQAQTTK